MTRLFSWTLICPLLLFSFVWPSVGGLPWWEFWGSCKYLLQSARRFVNQSGESGKQAEINKFLKRASRSTQLGPILYIHISKMVSALRASLKKVPSFCLHMRMRTVLAHNVLQLVRLAIPAFCGLCPSLIYSSEAANAQGASGRAHSC